MCDYCPRCGKEFKYKYLVLRHLSKKKPCQVNYISLTIDEIQKRYEMLQIEVSLMIKEKNKKEHERTQKEHEINVHCPISTRNEHKKFVNDESYTCESCDKTFNHKTSYYRHKKHYCKRVEDTSELLKLKSQVELLTEKLEKSCKNAINGDNNTLINGDSTNNIVVNNYNTIDFGVLEKEKMNKICDKPSARSILQDVFDTMYIHNPQNHVLYLTSKKADDIFLNTEKGWIMEDPEDILDEIAMKSSDIIFDHIDDPENYPHTPKTIRNGLCSSYPERKRKQLELISDSIYADENNRIKSRIRSGFRRSLVQNKSNIVKTHGGKIP